MTEAPHPELDDLLRQTPAPFLTRYGPWALVTGAARGIGAAFTRQLAARGFSLLLVDVLADELQAAAAGLRQNAAGEVRALACDLRDPDFLAVLEPAARGLDIGLVVANAAVGGVGPFLEQTLEHQLNMLAVNVRAPLLLARTYGPQLLARRRGGLILLSSGSALHGSPLVAHYAGTKAYNRLLAESLWAEWRGQGVDVLAVLPGTTDTPGLRSSNPQLHGLPLMTAEDTAAEALRALGRTPSLIVGGANRWAMYVLNLLPAGLAVRLMESVLRRMYPD